MNKVRIYTRTVNTWKCWEPVIIRGQYQERETIQQWELEYKEYDEEGNLVGTGTEDFGKERYREIDTKQIWTWDGKKLNKGGHRWFEYLGNVRFNLNDQRAVMGLMRKLHSDAALVQLRTI